jgi:hypothetical protein
MTWNEHLERDGFFPMYFVEIDDEADRPYGFHALYGHHDGSYEDVFDVWFCEPFYFGMVY